MSFRLVHRNDCETAGDWQLVRRTLGLGSFGINVVEIPTGGQIPEHDESRIGSMHAPDMVFENHTAGERAEGEEALTHIAHIFESWPDIEFETRRLYVREDLVVQEWTARATHVKPLSRGDMVAEPSGKRIEWNGMDVIPFQEGKVKRKDVYSDSVSILRQVGLL